MTVIVKERSEANMTVPWTMAGKCVDGRCRVRKERHFFLLKEIEQILTFGKFPGVVCET